MSAALTALALSAAPASALQPLGAWGTSGSGDGQLNNPFDLGVNPNTGSQYIADQGNNRVVQFDANGGFVRSWGTQAEGITVDSQGNVWVADAANDRIRKFDSAGVMLAEFGTSGGGPGQLSGPDDVAVDASGNFYVVEQGGRVQKFTPGGAFVKTWSAANPTGIAIAGSNVYAANYNSDTVEIFDTEGNPIGSFGSTGTGAGQFSQPWHLGVDPAGNVYVADRSNARVQVFGAAGNFISAFGWGVATGTAAFEVCTANCQAGIFGDGPGQFGAPGGVEVDCRGNVYVVDQAGRVQKFGEPGTRNPPCPSNHFSFGKVKKNKRKGTAKLTVKVPGPGILILRGRGLKKQRPAALASKVVAAAGKVKLRIRTKGAKKARLNRRGKVRVKAKVTFTPTNGDPNTKKKRIKLVKLL